MTAQSLLWSDGFGTEGQDGAFALATDGEGGVFVAGLVAGYAAVYGSGGGTGPGIGRGDVLLTRYDVSGERLWMTRFGSPEAYDLPCGVVFDGSGGAYVVGTSYPGAAGGGAGLPGRWLSRFDADGVQLWLAPLPSPATPWVAVANDSGGLLVCGTIGGTPDGWVASLDATGALLWSRAIPILVNDWDAANAVVSDGAGGAFVCGIASALITPFDGWLSHVDGSGTLLWTTTFATAKDDFANAIARDGSGGVFVGGSTSGSLGGTHFGSRDMWLARYNAAGQQTWLRQYGTPQFEAITALAASVDGGVLATVRANGDVQLGRFDSDGDVVYLADAGVEVGPYFTETLLSQDGVSAVLAGGTDYALVGGEYVWGDLWIARFDGSCNPGTTYCTASTTSIPGCQASISGSGSPTLSEPTAWTVSSGPVPGGDLGLMLFGSNGKNDTPYGTLGGSLCVASPISRTAPKTSGGDSGQCNGGYSFTLAELIAASPVVTSGATIHAQMWAREPANADGFLLSGGLEFTVCP